MAAAGLLGSVQTAALGYGGYTYTTLTDPQAGVGKYTSAGGTSGGVVSGTYQDSAGGTHGFIESSGGYTTLDYPLVSSGKTTVRGIFGNTVVGQYADGSNSGNFTEAGGVYTMLSANPLAPLHTAAYGLFGNTVVGGYGTTSGVHGFTEINGVYTTVDDPLAGTGGTEVWGIWGSTLVGDYQDSQRNEHGFLEANGVFSSIDANAPGTYWTQARGIWGNTVVGNYSNGGQHAFVDAGGVYTTLDYPAAGVTGTYLSAMDGNTVVGDYIDAKGNHGFVATLNTASLLPGDANMDGRVDLTDLNLLLNNLGVAETGWTNGNFDGAATIDLNDLNEVLNHLGTETVNGGVIAEGLAGNAVPEPGTMVVLAVGILGRMFRWRRREMMRKRNRDAAS